MTAAKHGLLAIAETIVAEKSISNARLWACAMPHMTYQQYEDHLSLLILQGLVVRMGTTLWWKEEFEKRDVACGLDDCGNGGSD